ncbi:MAG: HAD family hydrolase [Chthonomonas sp.]|nr:HAD family hydrolase [Chthonomonas sp.]
MPHTPHPTPHTPVRAVFLDLDDTLCAYWDASKAALKETFENHAPTGVPTETMIAAWAEAFRKFSPDVKNEQWYPIYLKEGGVTRVEQMRLALLELGHDDPIRAKALGDSYGLLRDQNLKLFPEALEVLDALKAKFPLGVMTNGPADIQRQELQTLGIEHYFDVFLIEGELGFGKPDPRVYQSGFDQMAAKLPGLKPDEILMIGNSYRHDILGAMEAGWQTAWVRRPSDFAPSATEPETKPDEAPDPTYEIGDLRELLDSATLS